MKQTIKKTRKNEFVSNPIAIIGFAFRFPGDLHDECAFWDALKEKKHFISQIPSERWATRELFHSNPSEPGRSITFSAGVLSGVDQFDPGFFGISPREAASIDPQQRLLLELAWEAMENAGIRPSSVAGTDCSVYVGISSFDYGTRAADDLASVTSHFMTGNTLSIAANRLSYVFDLRGPSLAIDTACSSSLVALHHACISLRTGEASTALVGGVNLLLHPHPFVGFTKASMLSPTGFCKPFDAEGDGYVRSEGGAVLLLKPLDKAIIDGDDIQAVILESGVNADGARKTGITIPSSDGQAELMREVLERSGLSAYDVDYLEAHGTGTPVGDPIEAAAIGQVYGQGRARALPIGSVKANLGHLETASGLAGLIKAVLVLKNRALPPALHLNNPNPNIDFFGLNLELITKYRFLDKEGDKPLIAGVNSFGFGGANSHVLLQDFRRSYVETPATPVIKPPLFLSARTDGALRALADLYADLLNNKSPKEFYDIAYATAYRRDLMDKRLVLDLNAHENAVDFLRQYALGEKPSQIIVEDSLLHGEGVAFVYSGNGAQWLGMGRALIEESARFLEVITLLDQAMLPYAGFSLIEELSADEVDSRLDDTVVAQPLLFAIQVAVTTLLREQGVEPLAVTGHSVGEIAAAWASGALDLENAIRVICVRSQAQGLTRGLGRMAAVGMSEADITTLLGKIDRQLDVEISGKNSPRYVSLSGSLESLMRIKAELEPTGVFFRLLDLDYAFHSHLMDAIQDKIAKGLSGISPSPTEQAIFVSTVTGDVLDGELLDAGYWWRNVREPVCFSDAIAKLCNLGCRTFIEIGPHAILQRYIRECLTAANVKGRTIPTLRRNSDGLQQINGAVMRAHLLNNTPPFHLYFPQPGQAVRLPNYPWQRERYWHPRTSEGMMTIERRRVHPLLGWRVNDAEMTWENTLDPSVLPWLADHIVGGAIVFPGSAYAEMALAVTREWLGGEQLMVEQLEIVSPMIFDGEHARSVFLVLNPRDGGFQIKSRLRLSTDEWRLHATGRLLESVNSPPDSRIKLLPGLIKQVDREAHYRLAFTLGLDYGPSFQGLVDARFGEDRLEATVKFPDSIHSENYILHPAILDVCFQSIIILFSESIEAGNRNALLPIKMGRLNFYRKAKVSRLHAHLRHRNVRSVLVDFELLDEGDNLIASVSDCRFRATHLISRDYSKISSWRIVPRLRPHPADSRVTELPAVSLLVEQMHASLASLHVERQMWFRQILPLIEVVTLSFAYEAFQKLAQMNPERWYQSLNSPYARWLSNLLRKENLLEQEEDRWALVDDTNIPSAKDLWQTILRDSPASLPQLTLLGRVGFHLTSLLSGEIDNRQFLNELSHVSVAESLYNDDPSYKGTRLALEGFLRYTASALPVSRRLRVLEITAGPSVLPKTLIDLLPEDRFDYVLALSDEEMVGRQQVEYKEYANVIVAALDKTDWKILADQSAPDTFDVVILRHMLYRTDHPRATLSQVHRWLAVGGVLLIAERHPDWSATFIEGLEPTWWYKNSDVSYGTEVSSLLVPEVWKEALIEEQFGDCELFFESAAEGLSEGAYLLLAKRKVEDTESFSPPISASWLFLADNTSSLLAEQLRCRLESCGQMVDIATRIEQYYHNIIDNIVYFLDWDATPETTTSSIADLLKNMRLIGGQSGKTPRLWFVTCGGALATDLPAEYNSNVLQSALWGCARVVMNEYPQLGTTLIDLACDLMDSDASARLAQELLQPDGASEIVLSPEARYCLAMREEIEQHDATEMQEQRFRLDFHVPGQLRNLRWLPDSARSLRDEEIEVRTKATGLNFRDVMYTMGLLPDEAVENGFAGANLGLEFSGVVTRVGSGVKDLLPGDSVMGLGKSCFASHIVTRADAVVPIPEGWTFEAAATVPTAFFTVYYALKHLADLQSGERVLIHGAAGGVGIAAIHIARHLGAEIYATAGSDEKRDFVLMLGADHVFDSRSLSFSDDILLATAGEGVDVVLNSLAGEAMRRSLDVLKPFGRFMELGKRDFFENTPIGVRLFKDNISYFGIDTDQLLTKRPQLATRLFHEVMILFREGWLSPLPYRTFTSNRVIDAFRIMQQSRHIGKIIVSLADVQPRIEQSVPEPLKVSFPKESTWLVTGGLSGFGLESARWLVTRGVGNIVLVGRRGMNTPGAKELIQEFNQQGVEVLVKACDITDADAIVALIDYVNKTMPPIKGILHAAAIFDDRLIATLDEHGIDTVIRPKLLGACLLHQATIDIPLEHFILYSSLTTAIGNPGQANYVAANAGLEGLTRMRRFMGLPAQCIAWGPIGNVGYLDRNESARDSLEQRLGRPSMSAIDALSKLDQVIAEDTESRIFANFDWSVLARLLPSSAGTRFQALNHNMREKKQTGEVFNIRLLMLEKSIEEIVKIVCNQVTQEIAQILCIGADRIDANGSLQDIGMDSLMAMELVVALEKRFGIQLPVMLLNDSPSVTKVTTFIIEKLTGGQEMQEKIELDALVEGLARQHGEDITPEEIESLAEETRMLARNSVRS